VAAVTPKNRTFDHASLRGLLDGRYADVREGLTAPGFPERYGGRGDPGANEEYIGNAACHGHVAAVFAQLVVAGVNHH
jgi:hypothetical protein